MKADYEKIEKQTELKKVQTEMDKYLKELGA